MLLIDIGNSETVAGLIQNDTLVAHWRFQTRRERTGDELRALFYGLLHMTGYALKDIDCVVASSVVPALSLSLSRAFADAAVHLVDAQCPLSFNIKVEDPHEVGADRLVNAEAALQHYGKPLIIVDAGTATTFCVVDGEKNYLGGAIAPGLLISARALTQQAARLAAVETKLTEQPTGRSTRQALRSGTLLGHAAMIDGMIERICEEHRRESFTTVATGGVIEMIAPALRRVHHIDPLLTLKGLQILGGRVCPSSPSCGGRAR